MSGWDQEYDQDRVRQREPLSPAMHRYVNTLAAAVATVCTIGVVVVVALAIRWFVLVFW